MSVPPFIAITVELRSADGQDYALRGGGKSLAAGEGENSDIDHLRRPAPGHARWCSRARRARVSGGVNAEPGP